MSRNEKEYYIGCLLGGAVGDALGWPVEFNDINDIVKRFGPEGVLDMVPGEGGLYEITDDTQMTLFTAEGLLRAWAAALPTIIVECRTLPLRSSIHISAG